MRRRYASLYRAIGTRLAYAGATASVPRPSARSIARRSSLSCSGEKRTASTSEEATVTMAPR